MRMKEVCEKTGLTDRAIRLYMENGLVVPRQESNYMGRRSFVFSEEDVRVLEAVATLRRANFSIAEIAQMQQLPESLPDIIDKHRQRLVEEIATKENILRSLKQYDAHMQMDYCDLADAIANSASRNSIPKEDSRMNLKEFKRIIRKRISSLIALVFLLLALCNTVSLTFRTAFAEIMIGTGGTYTMEYNWDVSAIGKHAVLLLSVVALLGAAVALIIYLSGGKRCWSLVSAACCALAVGFLLFMPAADEQKLYTLEFLTYRYSAGALYYYKMPPFIIKAVKYVPIVTGAALSCVGYALDKTAEEE